MSPIHIAAVATYLPPFEHRGRRHAGPDEDAITMAVAAGRLALGPSEAPVSRIVLVTRQAPLLSGGSEAVLATALGFGSDVRVVQQLGGAPSVLDAITGSTAGTLVLAADAEPPAGAGAVLVADEGPGIASAARVTRSLPVDVVRSDGSVYAYDDPRLLRERGFMASFEEAHLVGKVAALAGAPPKAVDRYLMPDAPVMETTGASAAVLALAALLERGDGGTVVGAEEACLAAATVEPGVAPIVRAEPAPRPLPQRRLSGEADIKFSLPAYERAFSAKVGFAAGRCPECSTLSMPPRHRCEECGHEGRQPLQPLPRAGKVYTATTVHVPVPGLATPYSLAVVELDDVGLRVLAHVTDHEPGEVAIGERGELVLRRVATRAGVPDYGYAFCPSTGEER